VCALDDAFWPTGEQPGPVDKFRIIEGFEHPVLKRYVRFLAATGIEVAGIEFIRRADGSIVTYDVNTNTNYNARAEAAAGRYGMQELARFLGRELAAEQARAAA
jgi:hypothetical protein